MRLLAYITPLALMLYMNILNIIIVSNAKSAEEFLNNSLIYETFNLQHIKGVMKQQTLIISKIKNLKNDWHTCYQAICQGKGCPSENAVIDFCYPAVIVTGLPKCGTTAMYDLLARYNGTILMGEKENCPFARRRPYWQFFNSLPSISQVTEGKLVIDGCIQVSLNMMVRLHLRQPKTLYVVMTRNYADMLWSSYNFWCRFDVDGPSCDSSRWATVGLHKRSNTLFHDIITADLNHTLHLKDNEGHSIIPNPTHVKHPCLDGGGYFSEYLKFELWRSVPRNETFVIASELLESDPMQVWQMVSSLFPSMNASKFNLGSFKEVRFNAQVTNVSKGQDFLLQGVPIEKYQPGRFAISNYQPLLPETRELLNKCWSEDCLFISKLTGDQRSIRVVMYSNKY